MIPVVDLSAADKVRGKLFSHPLYKRRQMIEQAFLDELTALTRKYGLEIKAGTRSEYGETYPEHELTVPYEGTEARYVVGTFGISFDSVAAKDTLPCSPEERKQYEKSKADREQEDKIISDFSRQISDLHFKAIDDGMDAMYQSRIKEIATRKPTSFSCSCGEKFKTEKTLKKHSEDTGHSA